MVIIFAMKLKRRESREYFSAVFAFVLTTDDFDQFIPKSQFLVGKPDAGGRSRRVGPQTRIEFSFSADRSRCQISSSEFGSGDGIVLDDFGFDGGGSFLYIR